MKYMMTWVLFLPYHTDFAAVVAWGGADEIYDDMGAFPSVYRLPCCGGWGGGLKYMMR